MSTRITEGYKRARIFHARVENVVSDEYSQGDASIVPLIGVACSRSERTEEVYVADGLILGRTVVLDLIKLVVVKRSRLIVISPGSTSILHAYVFAS